MALKAYTDSYFQEIGVVTMHGSWDGNDDGHNLFLAFVWGYGSFGSQTSSAQADHDSGSYFRDPAVDKDRTIKFKAKIWWEEDGVPQEIVFGQSSGQFKTYTDEPTANDPVVSAITDISATVDCVFDAGHMDESSFTVQLQYRKLGETAWNDFGTNQHTGTSISRSLTGLLGGTIYEVRLEGNRTTANTTEWFSNVVWFTTEGTEPDITTDAPSVVAAVTARLNGTVDPNDLDVEVFFGWGTADGGAVDTNWQNVTSPRQAFSGDTAQSFEELITGLSASTTYFFRAFVVWPDPGFEFMTSGDTVSFTTPTGPGVGATDEDHMHIYEFDAHYGVAHDVYFTLSSPSGTSSDRLVTTAPGSLFVTGDIKLSKDGGALANYTVANIVQVTASEPLYKMPLTATDLEAELLTIIIKDQNGPAFRDAVLLVRTKMRLGQLHVNASQIGSSASAIIGQPSTGGYGLDILNAAGNGPGNIRGFFDNMALRTGALQLGGGSSATLDVNASSTNDLYNGETLLIVSGAGVGQSRIITDYNGTTKEATVNSAWSVAPGINSGYVILPGSRVWDLLLPELASIPAAGGAAGLKLQFCYQRFAFKVDQTATEQKMYNFAGAELGSRVVSDDGTTQEIAKIS